MKAKKITKKKATKKSVKKVVKGSFVKKEASGTFTISFYEDGFNIKTTGEVKTASLVDAFQQIMQKTVLPQMTSHVEKMLAEVAQ